MSGYEMSSEGTRIHEGLATGKELVCSKWAVQRAICERRMGVVVAELGFFSVKMSEGGDEI
jgi:hypothetical protein